ncbi:tetrahydrobiopterin biosynthesis enzymes-like protein [Schizopora paradoxa]|uniref:dihydroneopterin aldolase n=1 Tax=Schizopora paradoxa TaxID=27342 RepID=A0A0H2RXC5_9AGAM|nr:tetrahydrobiopterin biosynthesis enzymes-like protein [Schizopora paradoxa]
MLGSQPNLSQLLDTVIIREIRAEATVGPDRWGKVRNQPVLVSVSAHTPLAKAGFSDDVKDSIHYGDLGKEIVNQVGKTSFPSLYALGESVAKITLEKGADSVEIEVEILNQFLTAKSLSSTLNRSAKVDSIEQMRRDKISIKDILLHIIIGVNPPERIHRQEILVNIDFWLVSQTCPDVDWIATYRTLTETIQSTDFQTLEAFATKVAGTILGFDIADTVTVTAQKPKALAYAHSSGVQITRSKADLQATI